MHQGGNRCRPDSPLAFHLKNQTSENGCSRARSSQNAELYERGALHQVVNRLQLECPGNLDCSCPLQVRRLKMNVVQPHPGTCIRREQKDLYLFGIRFRFQTPVSEKPGNSQQLRNQSLERLLEALREILIPVATHTR